MIDGSTDLSDRDQTDSNRDFVRSFVEDVLIGRHVAKLEHYVDSVTYTEHNPHMSDGLTALTKELADSTADRTYQTIHRILAEGNFVLCVCEGSLQGKHASFYDLFRLADGRIVEHWDTTEEVPPVELWKNNNGKF